MAIISSTFGHVTLTEDEAKKFKNQATYGRPKKAAVEATERGLHLVKKMKENGGQLTFTIKSTK